MVSIKEITGKIICADAFETLKTLPENSVDAVITDPPYHLVSIVKRFGKENSTPAKFGTDGIFARTSKGFMGKEWDGGAISFNVEMWEECLRVLKPGGHLLSFGGDRTHHRMMVAIEDAGFDIRTTLCWIFASGFPKSLNVTKKIKQILPIDVQCVCGQNLKQKDEGLIYGYQEYSHLYDGQLPAELNDAQDIFQQQDDVHEYNRAYHNLDVSETKLNDKFSPDNLSDKHLPSNDYSFQHNEVQGNSELNHNKFDGKQESKSSEKLKVERKKVSYKPDKTNLDDDLVSSSYKNKLSVIDRVYQNLPLCQECKKYKIPEGVGTALKPAVEFICLARKPLSEKTVAENVLKWKTGGINIDESRVGLTGNNPDDILGIVNKLRRKLCQCDHSKSSVQPADKKSIQRDTTNGIKNEYFVVENVDMNTLEKRLGITQEDMSKLGILCSEEMSEENTTTSLNTFIFGKSTMEKSQKDMKPITLTGIKKITELKICNSCQSPIIDISTILGKMQKTTPERQGRFPSNLLHDNSPEVRECFPESKTQGHWSKTKVSGFGKFGGGEAIYEGVGEKDKLGGSSARFFKSIVYYPKASKSERNMGCEKMEENKNQSAKGYNLKCIQCGYMKISGSPCKCENPEWEKVYPLTTKNNHPTVKPIALMEYLIKMITQKGGIVLDPFAGSFSTGVACIKNGFNFIGIEKEEEYCKIGRARMEQAVKQLKEIPQSLFN